MDIEQFKVFLKQKFIIINYPSGGLGGLLANALYSSNQVFSPSNAFVFDEVGALHNNVIESFRNFHNIDDLNNWINLSYDGKLYYLYKNCLTNFENEKYIIILLCCPNYSYELNLFFDEDKIITIKPNSKHYDILENLIFYKVPKETGLINFLKNKPKLHKFQKNILQNHKQELSRIISKKSAKFFIDDVSYNHKHLYDFEYFFSKEMFFKMLQDIEKQLDITLDYNKVDKLYENFLKTNEKYIESYLATKTYV